MNRIIDKFGLNTEFENSGLINKYFKTITVPIVILVMIIDIVVVFYYSSLLKNEMREKQTEQLYQYRMEFEKTQRNAEILYTWFLKDNYAARYFSLDSLYDVTGMEANELYNNLTKTLINVSSINTEIESVSLYNFNMNYYISISGSGFTGNEKEPEWYKEYVSNMQNGNSETIICKNDKIMYFLEVYDYSEKRGLIVFETQLPQMSYLNSKNSEIYILNDKNIIYTNRPDKAKEITDIKSEYKKYSSGIGNYGKSAVLLENSGYGEFTYFSVNSGVYSKNSTIFIITFIALSILFMIIVCLALSVIFGRDITHLAVSLMSMLGNPNDKNEYTKKEINYIVRSIFAKTDDSMDSLGKMLAKKMRVLKNSQIIALQTQITPHFLYNTLQSINLAAMSKFQGKNEISDMVYLFSNILHNALDTETYTVTLQKEIDYVKDYLDLQNHRYPGRAEVVWDIAAETLELETVKFSLQPIIENALTHGVYLADRRCMLWISAFIKEKNLVIEVKNDGKPIAPEKLKAVNELLENNEIIIKESQSIGLSNVNQRIKLIFGNDYGLLLSYKDGITVTTVKLPIIKGF